MGLLKTFAQIKSEDSGIPEVADTCVTSTKFRSRVNQATDILMQRGDWPGTIVPIHVCVNNGCIVWPRYVGRVRKLNRCNMPITVNNYWWDFVDREDYTQWCGMCFDNNWLTNTGYSALYQDVPNGDWLVRAYPTDSTDVGKTIKIFGLDGYGQRLMEKDSSGTWVDGLTITLAIPYGSTSVYVRQIERVIKQETEKPVFLYAYDPARDMLIDLAKYDPSETNPWYARDRLRTGCCNNLINGTTQTPFSVLALVKLKFIPVVADTDLVLIPSTMALKYAIQSVKYGDSQNADEAMKYMAMAIRELNHVMDNQIPQEDAAINTSFAGYERVGYQSVL